MQLPIALDRSLPQTLTAQLAAQLRAALREGRIPPGARLPSTRALAEQLGLARNTVVHAYETLTIEGLLESRAASGVYASGSVATVPRGVASSGAASLPVPSAPVAPRRTRATRGTIDFVPARPDRELFPIKTWRRLLQSCLAYRGAAGIADYGDAQGLHALRAAIAQHLSMSRGIVADPTQIVITSGAQEGLSLIARLWPGRQVVIEDPCYHAAFVALSAHGARMMPVRVDEQGLITSSLPESGASLAYVTPAHQFPTGHTLSPSRRLALVAWARRHDCYLIEDDYDGDFQYDGSPLLSLAALAPDCTIHLGTFSTTLGAGLRIGYLVAPPSLVEALCASKALASGGVAWLEQAALAELFRSGGYVAHVARSRALYRERRDTLLSELRRHFGNVAIGGEGCGLHVLWELPAGVPSAKGLQELARKHRVGVYGLAAAGAHEQVESALSRRSVLLGFAGMSSEQIEQGVARLSDAVDDTLDLQHDFLRELLLDQPLARPPRSPAPRQRPALRTVRSPARTRVDASGSSARQSKDATSMRVIRGIYRYPIKGLSPQQVRGVTLEAGKPFPFDRVFALTRPGVPVQADEPRWAKKGLFLMLMLDEALARVQTHVDADTLELSVFREQAGRSACVLRADLNGREGRAAVQDFFATLVPDLKSAPTLVHAPNGHFMDKPDSVMSCINLATVRALEAEWGHAVHPLRFRANFYFDGLRPWEEFDWVGSDIQLGDVLFRVDRRNGRCGATNVNPLTGERDLDIPASLRKKYGHKDLGVYLVARTGGKVVVGDSVSVPTFGATTEGVVASPAVLQGSFICRGCYYIYDEARGAPGVAAGTPFMAVGSDFRCPDCGTEPANFRPYVSSALG